jgi:pilus assembly protein Flp/PilA
MKTYMLIIALAIRALPSAAQEEGFRLLREKNYDRALAAFETYLDTAGHADAPVAFNAAVCAARVGDHAAAERLFGLSIEGGYNLFSAYAGKANALKEQGKTDEMVAALKAGMKAGTKADSARRAKLEAMYAAHFLAEGLVRFREGKVTAAAESYSLLTRMEGKRWQATGFLSLGTLYTANAEGIAREISGNNARAEAARARAVAECVKAGARLDRAAALWPDDPRLEVARERLRIAREGIDSH